jgi:hypothetical protein
MDPDQTARMRRLARSRLVANPLSYVGSLMMRLKSQSINRESNQEKAELLHPYLLTLNINQNEQEPKNIF